MTRLAAVSIDLDEIPCYTAIHGLPTPEGPTATAVYDRALPRLLDWLDELRVPATLFVVGRDLARFEARDALRRARAAGHEIANHSQSHFYDLTRRPVATQHAEVSDATIAIADSVGARPVGFRAPGYTISNSVLSALAAESYHYDSSIFPCPAYYGAKAAALGAIRVAGRQSRGILDDPRVLSSPADPYHVGNSPWRRGRGILEIPIGVTRGLRLPFIGTSVVLGGRAMARRLALGMVGRPLVSLELHGIDLADAGSDGLDFLVSHQPDLRRPLEAKREALTEAVRTLRGRGYEFTTLAQAAAAF